MTKEPQTAPASHNSSASREIEISKWNPRITKTLRGFFTATLPSGMVLHNLMLHEKGEARWISFPAREFVDSQKNRQFSPIIEFTNKQVADRFRDAVLAALDIYFSEVRP